MTCDTADCSVSFQPATYNTLKFNVLNLGVPLCNYVHHFSTASMDGVCENPGFRTLNLDPNREILPNVTMNEDSDWSVACIVRYGASKLHGI